MSRNSYIQHILSSIKLHPGVQITTFIVLTGTFFIITNFFLAKTNFDNVVTSWGEKVQLNVYLSDKATETERTAIHSRLSQLKEFDKLKFISKEQAAKDFMSSMESYAPDLLGNEDFGNPLPASFELSLKASIPVGQHVSILKAAAASVKKIIGVEDVSYGQGWVENYSKFVAGVKNTSYSLLLLLIIGTMLIVGNSIKSSISQRVDEIEVLELVGATKNMIRAPYVVEGAFWGLVCSVTAIIISYFFYLWQIQVISTELNFMTMLENLNFFSTAQVLLLILLGTLLGAAGAYLSVSRYNTGWAAASKANGKIRL